MMKKLTPHLSEAEMACRHCGKLKYDPKLGEAFEAFRRMCGRKPIPIVSGYRCPRHNKAIGGAKRSYHMYGRALDLHPPRGMPVKEFHKIAKAAQAIGAVGGVGGYKTWVHIDVGPKRNW